MFASTGYAVLAPVAAALASGLMLAVLRRLPRFLPDHPNARSLHRDPRSRSGGIAIVAGTLAAWFTLLPGIGTLATCALAVAAVSFIDDWRGLPAFTRLSAHLAFAVIFAWLEFADLSMGAAVALVLAIVWLANLYNFMDGSDGLAGGMAVIGFSALALGAWAGESPPLAWASVSVAAASAPFLALNFHPARIFMGDVGSIPLGFLAGALGLQGWTRDLWAWWFPFLVFSPFAVDATVTLARRLLRRVRVWQAHKEHYYQRLVQMGFGHRGTALAEYALMAAVAATGLWGLGREAALQGLLLAGWGIAYFLLMMAVDRHWRRFRGGADSAP